jgi:uncharacterized protein (TIGR02118 family)
MIVRMGLLTRKPGITTEQFRRHWRTIHGPLAARMPGLRRYQQNHVVGASPARADGLPEGLRLDGISELWFDDVASMRAAVTSDAYRAVAMDEPNFATGTKVIVAEQNVVVPLPPAGPLVKCMSALARAPGVEPADFRRAWGDAPAALVARLPGLVGYTRNVVVERASAGQPASFDAVPVDGIAELWFRDLETLRAAFASDTAREVESLAHALIGTNSTWMVEVHDVV